MAAPEGNQFWKLRSKHGRDILFASPELLWEAATEYFEHTDGRKWQKTEYNGKDAIKCLVPNETPYTLTGLCLYLGCGSAYFRNFKPNASEEFKTVITRIEEVIYTQKFEGASVGAFNANIIARDLGLADKKEVDKKTTKIKFTDAAG